MSKQHDARELSSVFSRINKGRLTLTLGILSVVFTLAIICIIILNNIRPSDSVFDEILLIPIFPRTGLIAAILLLLFFIFAPITGLTAFVMGYRHLRKIRTAVVDSSQRTATRVGVILGISGASLPVLGWVMCLFVVLDIGPFGDESVSNKDAIINDLNNLAAHAYQFRIRPSSMGGGQGSYIGFHIPPKMAENQNGFYIARVISKDSIEVIGLSKEKKNSSIRVILDENGRMSSWSYTGEFE